MERSPNKRLVKVRRDNEDDDVQFIVRTPLREWLIWILVGAGGTVIGGVILSILV